MNHPNFTRDALTLIGAPGSGKGTLQKNLQEALGDVRRLVAVGTGDILRDHVARGTDLGRQAKDIMAAGQLVPDGVMIPMVRERVKKFTNGPITDMPLFDGFPRTPSQAEEQSGMLDEYRIRNTAAHLDIPEEHFGELSKRMARRAAEALSRGEKIREDDANPASVQKRLLIAKETLGDIVQHFEARGELITVDAMGTPQDVCDQVHAHIMRLVGSYVERSGSPMRQASGGASGMHVLNLAAE